MVIRVKKIIFKFFLVYERSFETINHCRMDFEAYPFDVHYCYFLITSWTYDETVIQFASGEINYLEENQVVLLDYDIEIGPIPERMKSKAYAMGSYSHAGFEMRLARKPTKYLANYYAPTGILVMISWVRQNVVIS